MKTFLRNFLRNLLGPRSVKSQVSRLRDMASDLAAAADHHDATAHAYRLQAEIAQNEANHATRVFLKIDALLS